MGSPVFLFARLVLHAKRAAERVGARFITLLTSKEQCTLHKNIVFLELSRNSSAELEDYFNFVKNIPKKNDNFDLALRKRLFWTAKQPLLPCN